jgi:hypothetical protein
MKSTRALTRLGMLAVGLGIGGAIAATPGIASADSSFDWLSTVDSFLTSGALPAADSTPELNLAISFDGMSLFQDGSAYAYTGSDGDFAVANGAGAVATAYGSDSYAAVDGVGSTATAGAEKASDAIGSSNNVAFVFGDGSNAFAGGTAEYPGSSDYSVIFGNGDIADTGSTAAGAGSYDVAYAEGNNLAPAYAQGANYLFELAKFYGDGGTTSTAAATDTTNLLSVSDPSGALVDGQAFWADLFSGDTSGALTAGTGFWTDLVSAFDGAGTAADASNLWTELAALF